MKKITIIFLLIVFILFVLEPKRVFSLSLGLMVPVIDEKAIQALSRIADTLDSILTLTSNELQKLNRNLLGVLETSFEEAANKVFTDLLKEAEFQKYSADLLKFIQLQQKRAQDPENAIIEAKKAGVYKALLSLPESIPCINPKIRTEFTNHVLNLAQNFNLLEKAQEVLKQIPDCVVTATAETTVSLKSNFLSWLLEPFQLNLAQVSGQLPEIEVTPITIRPAFQETEETIELNDLNSLASNLILTNAEESGNAMRKQIGDTWPVMECIAETTDFDGGEYVCLKYQTLISGEELKNFKQDLVLNNPLKQTTQDINIYQKFVETPNAVKKIGLATSSVANSSELGGILTDEKEIKEIADRACRSFAVSEEKNDNPTLAYTLCLKQFTVKLQKYASTNKKEIEQKQKQAEDTKETIDSTKQRAENLRDSLANCPSAYKDLENLVQELGGKTILYSRAISEITETGSEINSLISQINNLSLQIDNLATTIFITATDVLTVLNDILSLFKSNNTLSLFGFDLNLSIISDTLGKLKNNQNQILPQIQRVVSSFDRNLSQFANVVSKLNQLNYKLYQDDFSRSDILNDTYQLQLILQKLDAYERLAQKGGCSVSSEPGISLLNKNQVIVIESKKSEIKSINFLALTKKLFQPRLVEIRNER